MQVLWRRGLTSDWIEISHLCARVEIAGAVGACAREGQFTILRDEVDRYFGKAMRRGDALKLSDGSKMVFHGLIWETNYESENALMDVVAYDKMKFFLKSTVEEGSFVKQSAKAITERLCKEVGVSFGDAPAAGASVSVNCRDKTGYETLMMVWNAVRRETGKPYYPLLVDGKLHIVEKGKALPGKALAFRSGTVPGTITSLKVHESSEEVCTALFYTDDTGKIEKRFYDKELMKLYGYIQKIRSKEVSKEAPEINAGKVEVSVEAIGDWDVQTGFAVQLEAGRFSALLYVEADRHVYEAGLHTMELTLSYDNVMDEIESEESASDANGEEGKVTYRENVSGEPAQFNAFGYCGCPICAAAVRISGSQTKFRSAAGNGIGETIYIPSLKDWPSGGNFKVTAQSLLGDDTVGLYFESHDEAMAFGRRMLTVYTKGSRTVIKAVETKESGNGGGSAAAGDGITRGRYIDPTRGAGIRTQGPHYHGNAIDIAVPVGTPIVAADGGSVTYAGAMGTYGNVVFIAHGAGQTRYAHLSRIAVSVGQKVSQGQVIGASGNTGASTGPHLHFEINHNGRWTYPGPLIGR